MRTRVLIAFIVCLAGAVLAWRSFDRSTSVDEQYTPPVPPSVTDELDATEDALVPIADADASALLDAFKASAARRVRGFDLSDATSDFAATEDLAEAFSARASALLGVGFESSLADMESCGWPEQDERRLQEFRNDRESFSAFRAKTSVSPDRVEVRWVDPAAIADPKRGGLPGYGRICFQMTPLDEDGNPITRLSEPDRGLVEIRFRARTPNIDGEPIDVFLGYRFTWDPTNNVWRWVQTCVYKKPGSRPVAFLPVI